MPNLTAARFSPALAAMHMQTPLLLLPTDGPVVAHGLEQHRVQ